MDKFISLDEKMIMLRLGIWVFGDRDPDKMSCLRSLFFLSRWMMLHPWISRRSK